jgi:hypothetical protein
MLHRVIRKQDSQEDNKTAEVKSQSEDSRTVDEITQSERCAIPKEIFNQISVISSAANKTNCEMQTEILGGYVESKRLENECLTGALPENDSRCKYVRPK